MEDPEGRVAMDWSDQPNYPRPDYLSSSRKRLAPQLLFKGGILHTWRKKSAVALNKSFFETLPQLTQTSKNEADIAWLIYDLQLAKVDGQQRYKLTKLDEVYTEFTPALHSLTTPIPGAMDSFVQLLQCRLDEQLETPPNGHIIENPF